ncbi:hypothetical protein RI367_007896 [Sorochytrium milnesiophthora]
MSSSSSSLLVYTVPMRFLASTGYLVVLVSALLNKDVNVQAALPPAGSASLSASFGSSTTAALALGLVCFAYHSATFLSGLTMFDNQLNLLHTVFYLCGAGSMLAAIEYAWHYIAYWYILGLVSFVPTLVDVWTSLRRLPTGH